ncbi:MAG TPA: NUDIX hydrolase [Microbacteriaceae bacterium]|nr:NUDIX hydrolase [Microbacteriaceae bacterium]
MIQHKIQASLRGVRDPGDAWVVTEDGKRYWGKFGAAGLLALDQDRGVLMQHRVEWSDHGGTWGIPGGAINLGEDAISGAIREAHEEAGVPYEAIHPLYTHVFTREVWSYTTVIARVVEPFEPQITDPESLDLRWVKVSEVTDLPLHPGFRSSWSFLSELLKTPLNDDVDLTKLQASGHALTKIV